MSKNQTIFICSNCGAQFQKWVGRCLECGKWGTIDKNPTIISPEEKTEEKIYPTIKTFSLNEIKGQETQRIKTGINEMDRVLGGGLVPGSFILLGGEPGIGKSTIALQLANAIKNTIYISGEESVEQIKMRADRLEIKNNGLMLANETHVEKIIATLKEKKPTLAVIDSAQTIYSAESDGEAGGLSQIRVCATKIMEVAKTTNTAIVLVGHVTKDGEVAGPKTLEHLVDTVLYLEGDRHHFYRILRTVKNRFGSTDEVGVFNMAQNGLEEVKNPSASFLSERQENLSGNVITCLMEGTRPMLLEIQALVSKTSFGYPVRKANGFDLNRLHVLIAVLQKRVGLNLESYDIHLNVVGGLTADEPAADLAAALAIASAFKDKPLDARLASFGEVGLNGEIRPVPYTEKRIKECEQLGMKAVITNLGTKNKIKPTDKIKIVEIKNIQEIIKHT